MKSSFTVGKEAEFYEKADYISEWLFWFKEDELTKYAKIKFDFPCAVFKTVHRTGYAPDLYIFTDGKKRLAEAKNEEDIKDKIDKLSIK